MSFPNTTPPPVFVTSPPPPTPAVTTVVDSKPDAPVTVVTAPATAPPVTSETVVTTSAPLTQTQAIAIAPALQATQQSTSPPASNSPDVYRTSKRDIVNPALLVIIAIFIPPVSVYMVRGCGGQLAINIVMYCLLLWLPCFIHAVYIIFHEDPDFVKNKAERQVRKQQAKAKKEERKMAIQQEKLQAAQSQQALMAGM